MRSIGIENYRLVLGQFISCALIKTSEHINNAQANRYNAQCLQADCGCRAHSLQAVFERDQKLTETKMQVGIAQCLEPDHILTLSYCISDDGSTDTCRYQWHKLANNLSSHLVQHAPHTR